ncbi:MAG: transporter ATP-binding protein [Nevskia sp.]|nr:transporter ATP-binding protein [Nevskia sp.]
MNSLRGFGCGVVFSSTRLSGIAALALICCVVLEATSLAFLTPLLAMARNGADLGSAPLAGWCGPLAAGLGFNGLLCAYVVVLGLLSALIQYSGVVHRRIAYAYVGGLRRRLLAGLLGARWSFVSGLKSAEMTYVLTTATGALLAGAQQFWQLLSDGLVILVYTTICAVWSPQITLLAALGLVLPLWLGALRKPASGEARRRHAEAALGYDATVADSLASVRWAKTHGTTARVFEEMERSLDAYAGADVALLRHNSANRVLQAAWGAVMMGLTLYLALARLHLPLSQIVVLLFVFFRLWPRVGSLTGTYHQIDHALPFLDHIRKLIQTIEVAAEPACTDGGRLSAGGAIQFREVSFRYGEAREGQRAVLHRLTACIEAGTITALAGPSGTGKSTFLDLVAGLLQAESGQMLVGGVPLGPDLLPAWRRSIACVGADCPLFHTSLRENLLLGSPAASDDELWAALELAAAGDFVRRLPDALDSPIGDRGARLSAGERQRICLARAILQRPELLILDEATNALDAETEAQVFAHLRGWKDRRTVLIVSHRDSVHRFADQVLELKGGVLASMKIHAGGRRAAVLAFPRHGA